MDPRIKLKKILILIKGLRLKSQNLKSKHWGPNLKCHKTSNWRVKLKRKIKLTKESKTKNKN
jgi:hypothetical protein